MKNIRYMAIVTLAAAGLALAGCGGGGDGISTSERDAAVEEAVKKERMALQMTIDELEARLGIEGDTDPGDDVATLKKKIDELERKVKEADMAQDEADRKAAEAAAAAMAATAAKLYAGIGAPSSTSNAMRAASYVTRAGNPTGASVGDIAVTIGDGGADNSVALSEDKKAMVPDNDGWTGMKYTRTTPASEGTYEAIVYSNVGEPTEGKAFDSDGGSGLAAVGGTSGEFTIPPSGEQATARIDSTSFDHTAGEKTFKLGDNLQRVILSGSYYGVSGTYYCDPAEGEACGATVAADGFTLGGGNWSFKPTDPKAKVMSMPDDAYASYGWWIRKSADDKTYTASAFAAYKGTDASADTTDLHGTATYMGGAAGKYALSSSTGGTNDAGHFTASAMLEADFDKNMISGTIDDFMGADGESRDWSVALNKGTIAEEAGSITGMETVWTIDGAAGSASGEWSGQLHEKKDDVPQVATGTFFSTYGEGNSMVGAFGANKQ